ncbi:hypothetical protein J2S54_006724 [Streptomyces sp. DSM 42143]|nr:hypothetical protein [Streptomyces sp. DSM 42143]
MRLQGEGPGRSAVGVLETGTGPERVHQVVRHIDAAQGGGDRLGVGDIPAHRLDIPRPGVIPQFPRGTSQTAHTVAGLEQFRHQAPADVAGRPGDEAVQLLGLRESVAAHHAPSESPTRRSATSHVRSWPPEQHGARRGDASGCLDEEMAATGLRCHGEPGPTCLA